VSGLVVGRDIKTPVIETSSFTAYYEQYEEHTFLHCDVYRYNRTVKRDLKHGLKLLLLMRTTPLFAIHEQGDTKHLKFLTMLGFEYLTTTPCEDGKNRDIYITD